jgi:hypothetical protein
MRTDKTVDSDPCNRGAPFDNTEQMYQNKNVYNTDH